ncbi:MAG: hypothetical protein EA360_07180 [Balneolaceae bacterium]|nr:MAG: hypothetical protein EA360_07180 [Balneolaceae bacterium]
MIRVTLLTVSLLASSLLFSAATAQSDHNFEGTWQIDIPGTPYGDVTLMFEITRVDGSLSGNILIEQGEATVQNIIERDNTLVVYWVTGEYDLDMNLTLTEEDKLDGWLANTLRVSGTRVSE